MALPSTGGSYSQTLQGGINTLNIRKGICVDILLRDYLKLDGTVNDLSDPEVGLDEDGNFNPFAEDGKLRTDLLITSPGANLGFYHPGSLHEDGLELGYNTDSSETMIAQSKRPARVDVTSDVDTVTIRAVESNPIVDALRFDLPLSNLPDLGKKNYTIRKPVETPLVERQVIALGFDGDQLWAATYPRMVLRNRGNSNWNKEDPDVMELELASLLCPYAGTPMLLHRDGAGWRGSQGRPVFAQAPTATALVGQEAEIEFARPTSKSSTLTYTVEKSNNGTSGWTTATVEETSGSTNISIVVSGITSSQTWYFRVTATGTNGLSRTSPVTTSVIGLS